jgi:hypothetical protein
MALFRNLGVNQPAADKPAGFLVRRTRGYVEDFREPFMRKRSVQIESKIAQFRLKGMFNFNGIS